MKTARMFLSVYALYRKCNPLPVALRVAWRGCSQGTEMDCQSGKVVHTLKTAKAATNAGSGMWAPEAGSSARSRPSTTTTGD